MSKKLQINYTNTADAVALEEGEEQNQSLSPYAKIFVTIIVEREVLIALLLY